MNICDIIHVLEGCDSYSFHLHRGINGSNLDTISIMAGVSKNGPFAKHVESTIGDIVTAEQPFLVRMLEETCVIQRIALKMIYNVLIDNCVSKKTPCQNVITYSYYNTITTVLMYARKNFKDFIDVKARELLFDRVLINISSYQLLQYVNNVGTYDDGGAVCSVDSMVKSLLIRRGYSLHLQSTIRLLLNLLDTSILRREYISILHDVIQMQVKVTTAHIVYVKRHAYNNYRGCKLLNSDMLYIFQKYIDLYEKKAMSRDAYYVLVHSMMVCMADYPQKVMQYRLVLSLIKRVFSSLNIDDTKWSKQLLQVVLKFLTKLYVHEIHIVPSILTKQMWEFCVGYILRQCCRNSAYCTDRVLQYCNIIQTVREQSPLLSRCMLVVWIRSTFLRDTTRTSTLNSYQITSQIQHQQIVLKLLLRHCLRSIRKSDFLYALKVCISCITCINSSLFLVKANIKLLKKLVKHCFGIILLIRKIYLEKETIGTIISFFSVLTDRTSSYTRVYGQIFPEVVVKQTQACIFTWLLHNTSEKNNIIVYINREIVYFLYLTQAILRGSKYTRCMIPASVLKTLIKNTEYQNNLTHIKHRLSFDNFVSMIVENSDVCIFHEEMFLRLPVECFNKETSENLIDLFLSFLSANMTRLIQLCGLVQLLVDICFHIPSIFHYAPKIISLITGFLQHYSYAKVYMKKRIAYLIQRCVDDFVRVNPGCNSLFCNILQVCLLYSNVYSTGHVTKMSLKLDTFLRVTAAYEIPYSQVYDIDNWLNLVLAVLCGESMLIPAKHWVFVSRKINTYVQSSGPVAVQARVVLSWMIVLGATNRAVLHNSEA